MDIRLPYRDNVTVTLPKEKAEQLTRALGKIPAGNDDPLLIYLHLRLLQRIQDTDFFNFKRECEHLDARVSHEMDYVCYCNNPENVSEPADRDEYGQKLKEGDVRRHCSRYVCPIPH